MNTPVSSSPSDTLLRKRDQLLTLLGQMRRVIVAYSGGVDSTVVAAAAFRALGDNALAVTADSPSVPRAEIDNACRVAQQIGIRHQLIQTHELDNPDYRRNDGSRCYHCKSELYDRLAQLRPTWGDAVLCSGANLDDLGDYRPGLTAAAERGVRHPLQEAGFTKADVRALARWWDLPVWDKPASPCLSSRLAPGVAVTPQRTAMIEHAEQYLRDLGLSDCRVRLHENELARIEVPPEAIARLAEPALRHSIVQRLQELGFAFVTLDLVGLRRGSMNHLIRLEIQRRFAPVDKEKTS